MFNKRKGNNKKISKQEKEPSLCARNTTTTHIHTQIQSAKFLKT